MRSMADNNQGVSPQESSNHMGDPKTVFVEFSIDGCIGIEVTDDMSMDDTIAAAEQELERNFIGSHGSIAIRDCFVEEN